MNPDTHPVGQERVFAWADEHVPVCLPGRNGTPRTWARASASSVTGAGGVVAGAGPGARPVTETRTPWVAPPACPCGSPPSEGSPGPR